MRLEISKDLELLPVPGPVSEAVAELVSRYQRHREDYQRADYKEARLRSEFVDPFFEALGWDVHNKSGYSETYKDVMVEDSLRVGILLDSPPERTRLPPSTRLTTRPQKRVMYSPFQFASLL